MSITPHTGEWLDAPDIPALPKNELHIWRATLDQSLSLMKRFEKLLAPDECERAERFRFERDQRHFIAARGILRSILGSYMGIDAASVRFCYAAQGKPALPLSANRPGPPMHFNLSHSHECVLYGFSLDHQIGIDVEYMRPLEDAMKIAAQFFSNSEIELLRALPDAQKHLGFYNCWMRKEAYIKATGEGLSMPLDQFDVSLAPHEPARLLNIRAAGGGDVSRWSLLEVNAGAEYAAAAAVAGSIERVAYWAWRECDLKV